MDKKYNESKDLGIKIPSQTNKRAVPQEQWQVHFPASACGYGNDPAGAFLPRSGKNRAQPHTKINETDH